MSEPTKATPRPWSRIGRRLVTFGHVVAEFQNESDADFVLDLTDFWDDVLALDARIEELLRERYVGRHDAADAVAFALLNRTKHTGEPS